MFSLDVEIYMLRKRDIFVLGIFALATVVMLIANLTVEKRWSYR